MVKTEKDIDFVDMDTNSLILTINMISAELLRRRCDER